MMLENPPAGPIFMMPPRMAFGCAAFSHPDAPLPWERMRLSVTSAADMYWETMVASATPATPMPKAATVTMLRMMLMTPASDR